MSVIVSAVGLGLRATALVAPDLAGRWTFELFCQLRAHSAVRPPEARMHALAKVETIEHNGRKVKLYQWGDGEKPVLMVHGWESRGSRYALLAERLVDRGYTAVTFDAPGNGDSEGNRTTIIEYTDIITELYERHGPFHAVVGHSFGAPATFHALRCGLKADRIVILNGVSEFSYLVRRFADELSLSERMRADLTRRFQGLFPTEPDIYERFSVGYQADRITAPILVVHEEGDPKVYVEQGRVTAAAYRHARFVLTQGLGHSGVFTDPASLSLIADFIDSPAN